eukprot:scaffold16595_cov232-Amphora_coffeaeformis.AAC.3
MHPALGEEQKDEASLTDEQGGSGEYGRDDDDCHNDSDDNSEELVDLSPEITQLIGEDRVFESEEELFDTLEKVGIGDLRVVLVDGKPCLPQDTEGLQIYRLHHGTTVDDAHDVNNPDAEVWDYFPGGRDSFLVITPQDLGITGISAVFCRQYRIKVSELFQSIQEYHEKRQALGLAT